MPEESPIRDQRIHYARENERGVLPLDPTLQLFSDNVTSFAWSPDVGIEVRRGLGSPDVSAFHKGVEEHEVTVEYDLQRFVVDASGDPLDATGDGILRDANNALPNAHTIVKREDIYEIDADDTVDAREGGSGSTRDTRLYVVVVGARIDSVELGGDPGSDQPVTVSLTYTAEKGREYQVDQPADGSTLDLVSSSDQDTMDVTVEADDGTSETVTLDGTTAVPTPSTFDSIDAIRVEQGADQEGDIQVQEQSSGETLAVIRGTNAYDHDEADEGIPALGSGSRESSIGSSYETIVGDFVERPADTRLAAEINSVTYTVENNLGTRERVTTPRMGINAGNRDVSVDTTIVGATESVQKASEAFQNEGHDVIWILDGGELRALDARLTEFGGVDESTGDAVMSTDNTFTGKTPEVVAN
jgi:hypothetical protein